MRTPTPLALAALLLGAAASAQPVAVTPTLETRPAAPATGNNLRDVALWVNPADGGASLLIAGFDTAAGAGGCFDQDEAQLRKEIDDLRAAAMAEARRDRLIASRELRISTNQGMRAACWFNAAAAHFNLGARDQARVYAEKVLDDQRFGARARDLLSRLGPSR